jgi:hypothetical protein
MQDEESIMEASTVAIRRTADVGGRAEKKPRTVYDNINVQFDRAANLVKLDENIRCTAAYIVALSHLERVYKERCIFP